MTPGQRARSDRLTTSVTGRTTAGSRTPSPGVDAWNRNEVALPSIAINDASTQVYDPVASGVLLPEQAEHILDMYRSNMMSQFPFVILSDMTTVDIMRRKQPFLCLAVLASASFGNGSLQQTLDHMFNRLVAATLADGQFVSFDLLQGLLVCLSWAHYQPRPRRFSQHLHLATSIVADMRLDRPKNPSLWNIEKVSASQDRDWTADELRALVGTYYLTSGSSVYLQKMRHFPYTGFILTSGQILARSGEHAMDIYLPYIVNLQHLSEDIDDMVQSTPSTMSIADISKRTATIRERLDAFKSSLTFPLSNCPTMILQMYSVELLIVQPLLPGLPFRIRNLEQSSSALNDTPQLVQNLTDCISASKALINILVVMTPPGEEFSITDLGWIMLSFGTSLAVRLDVAARNPQLWPMTQHLVRFLDIRHCLQQMILRLEGIASQSEGSASEPNTFSQLLHRARKIEAWYLRHPVTSPTLSSLESNTVSNGVDVLSTAVVEMPLQTATSGLTGADVLATEFSGIDSFMGFSMPNFMDYEGQDLDLFSMSFSEE